MNARHRLRSVAHDWRKFWRSHLVELQSRTSQFLCCVGRAALFLWLGAPAVVDRRDR